MKGNYIIKLNNKCNMNCAFCADSSKKRHMPDPQIELLKNELSKNREKFETLSITGGEPTIYPHLFEFLEHANKNCGYKQISIATNGLLLSYNSFTAKLVNAGVCSFQISYFAADEKEYDALSRRPGSFKLVKKGIENAVKTCREVRINVVINKLNYRSIPLIVKTLILLNVKSINLAFMNPIGDSIVNNKSVLLVTYNQVMPYIKEAFEKAECQGFRNLYIENFPICIAKDLAEKISDLKKPEENKEYYNQCKSKPQKCKKCVYYKTCDGAWTAYLTQTGATEISPLK